MARQATDEELGIAAKTCRAVLSAIVLGIRDDGGRLGEGGCIRGYFLRLLCLLAAIPLRGFECDFIRVYSRPFAVRLRLRFFFLFTVKISFATNSVR
jgi:hypothetical protein